MENRDTPSLKSLEGELYDEVLVTVVHEIAHHFGIGEQRLAELGWD